MPKHYCLFIFILVILSCQKSIEFLPVKISDYKLTQLLNGKEAKEYVNKIHQKAVTDEKNEIAFYSSNNGKLTIYITTYKNEPLAVENYLAMVNKISPQNSLFINGSKFEIENKEVYRCFGMGQTHFIFSHQNKLFWISVNTVKADEFLNNYFNLIGIT